MQERNYAGVMSFGKKELIPFWCWNSSLLVHSKTNSEIERSEVIKWEEQTVLESEMDYYIRALTNGDETFLWQMLYEAAHLAEEGEPLAAVRNYPNLAKYVKNWGREDDMGFVAMELNSNQAIGATWLRLLTGEEKGYGYVDDTTPELAIAVLPHYRNSGVGTQLLIHLLEAAKAYYPSVSLSVRATNPEAFL